ncbi:unnamed protein product (macronuclear) [Paramecium tetraurelia]|uniref:Uncharacterized protein n=1 Tax=Paramecium tetraurelia TaxID=5888 RepID=A0BR08_PARTE|nr:uncharacterized protein GSPATT00031204001 [Paramecium tetraurelia]CAK60975.1 unnamed protein product [Paramecium tetraurelia]|eukprot:XP_001428373.1 hypothetical protein (macronuclear) [Paramecium tetraurelia strain d4-2]
MNTFNIDKNKYVKKAKEKKSQNKISSNPLLLIKIREEDFDDLNTSTSPHLSIPIFSPTKFIFPSLVAIQKVK